jgi:hypothetical protein
MTAGQQADVALVIVLVVGFALVLLGERVRTRAVYYGDHNHRKAADVVIALGLAAMGVAAVGLIVKSL